MPERNILICPPVSLGGYVTPAQAEEINEYLRKTRSQ